jgi:hypothetical protein
MDAAAHTYLQRVRQIVDEQWWSNPPPDGVIPVDDLGAPAMLAAAEHGERVYKRAWPLLQEASVRVLAVNHYGGNLESVRQSPLGQIALPSIREKQDALDACDLALAYAAMRPESPLRKVRAWLRHI